MYVLGGTFSPKLFKDLIVLSLKGAALKFKVFLYVSQLLAHYRMLSSDVELINLYGMGGSLYIFSYEV